MFRRLLSVGGFTLLSRITGFCRDILMAAMLGAGTMSDAFVVAFLFPNYFRALFGEGTINPAFLPRYAALRARGEIAEAARFGDEVFSWQMAAQLAVLVAAMAAMPWVVRALAPGFADNAGEMVLTAHLARITFPYLILTVVAVQLSAMLNALEKFAAAAAWPVLLNVAMIAALLASAWFPTAAEAAAWGVLAGGVLQLVFILWVARREGLDLRISWPRWTPEIKEFLIAFGAVTFGAASVMLAPFIDTVLASFLETGSRTALYYADRIDQLPLGVLGIALGTVLLPEMSAKLAVGDDTGSSAAQNRAASLALLLTLPFAVAFVVIPSAIMRAVFAHGAFDPRAAAMSAMALRAYGAGLPAFALVRIAQSTYYARHDTMTPARVTVGVIIANISMKVAFVWGLGFGVAGLAFATALAAWINVAVLVTIGRMRGLVHVNGVFWRALPPTLLAALLTAAGALIGEYLGHTVPLHSGTLHDLATLALAAVLGAAGYFATVVLFRQRLPLGRFARGRVG
ncbi:MAG: murein biosynthesis integral membrane protein MurJ [Alphaproteobacteria bacterium]|nr:murein biosynthesis integral membrane protein MurJ [Alphaproteobacteria bacterium]MDE2013889.1 murein biosynthesis integral membrane protein MurJ [Alphaproteobacteria bacterium]MDE2073060.1 murein biosynthesis integral membrane protein MurJ [Alphaproteobacteria bacterium]MDE2351788.1 murein biosynthesis integral membrane protein MurJ [Alphaproteobacteria bacterium]